MDEFQIKNQIVSLVYNILETYPDKFAKLDDNTVSCVLDITPKLSFEGGIKRLIQLKIMKNTDDNLISYTLHAIGGGDIYFNYFISALDPKVAYKFFQTDLMERKEIEDLSLVRDSLLPLVSKGDN